MNKRWAEKSGRGRWRRREERAWARIERLSAALAESTAVYLETVARLGGEKNRNKLRT